jgi:hypothetical protein
MNFNNLAAVLELRKRPRDDVKRSSNIIVLFIIIVIFSRI